MNRSFPAIVAALTGTLILILTGCATGVASFPDVAPAASQVPLGTIQGSNYGGHAPIVGAHLFVLQVGTGGYGSKVSSLLSAGETTTDYYGSVYTTAQDNVSGSPTNGMYYITTDSRGDFALSGDYTCTAGLPVYVYASGGNPETNPAAGFAVNVTGASAAPDAAGNLLVTFTTTGNNLLYQGETVNFNNFSGGGNFQSFANSTQVVSPLNLTTNTFAVELGQLNVTLPTQEFSATVTQNTPIISNPAIVNIALLGNCPGSATFAGIPDGTSTNTLSGVSPADLAKLAVGNVVLGPGIYNATITGINSSTGTITFNQADTGGNPAGPFYSYASSSTAAQNFSYLNFLYMNEVSTVAAMEALAPFASTTANNDALHIGTSSTNLAGLQNAVLNAANLYDIQGSNVGTGADGDTHIARAVTPTNSGGTVPQSLLNTLGNLLANCVDSANTYNAATASSGTQSAQCAALMNNATSDGTTTGTKPNDTATAMLNIAHYPAGEPSGNTTFMSGLFNSITGNVPFQPTLGSAPNDFSVGISYSGNGLASPGNVAIDASGDAWITGNGNVVELGPNGTPISGTTGYATAAYQNRAPVIDSSGNAWFISVTGGFSGYVNKMSSSGTLLSGSGYDSQSAIEPYSLAVDANNNIWVANTQSTQAADNYAAYITELNQSGSVVQTVNANPTFAVSGANVLLGPNGIALDGNGLLWIDGSASGNVASISTSSGTVTWYNNTSSTASNDPEFLAIDQNNKLWVPNVNTNFVQTVTPSAATNTGTNTYSYNYPTYTGGGLNGAESAAVDGSDNIWVMSANQKYVSEFNNSGTALTPAGGYAGGFGSSGGGRLAIDGSGDIWMPISGGNNVIEMIGVATPVVTPMVTAAKTGRPAAKP
jgi:hypothetical protein